jgi:hypothetical protein
MQKIIEIYKNLNKYIKKSIKNDIPANAYVIFTYLPFTKVIMIRTN